ncbi:hypothetical protein K437DRAFT_296439, partial [Tilletiaria anomala UBC 951]
MTGFESGTVDVSLGGSSKVRSTVDIKKLEKQEAKARAKLAKRVQRDRYESSKLVENARRQENYEMFLKVKSLETAGVRGKNKDINLLNIDLNFGNNCILTNATLSLARGRRYGVIGRNGVGQSTLLRKVALREILIVLHTYARVSNTPDVVELWRYFLGERSGAAPRAERDV